MKKIIFSALICLTVYLNMMYDWKIGTIVLAAELVFPVICLFIACWNRRKMHVRIANRMEAVEQGEQLPFWVEVTNGTAFPAAVQAVCSSRYAAERKRRKKTYRIYVDGKSSVKQECMLTAERCGRLEFDIRKIKVYDCWGFFSVPKKIGQKESVTIMPKLCPLNLFISSRTKWFPIDGESYAQDRSGDDNAEIYEVREYRAGDRMQKVHWKLSAKEEELYIKEFSYPLGAAVVFLLEGNTGGRKKALESSQFLTAVVSVAFAFLEKRCPYYMVWREKNGGETKRRLVREEEDFYEVVTELLALDPGALETGMEEHYRHDYKNAPYASLLKLTPSLILEVNGERMDMKEKGIEAFFETVEMVV